MKSQLFSCSPSCGSDQNGRDMKPRVPYWWAIFAVQYVTLVFLSIPFLLFPQPSKQPNGHKRATKAREQSARHLLPESVKWGERGVSPSNLHPARNPESNCYEGWDTKHVFWWYLLNLSIWGTARESLGSSTWLGCIMPGPWFCQHSESVHIAAWLKSKVLPGNVLSIPISLVLWTSSRSFILLLATGLLGADLLRQDITFS